MDSSDICCKSDHDLDKLWSKISDHFYKKWLKNQYFLGNKH